MFIYNRHGLWKCLCLVVSVGCIVILILDLYLSRYNRLIGGGWPHVGKYDGAWIKVTGQLSVFSAHYDDRGERDNFARVQIMAFVKDSYHRTMYCYFEYSNNTLCLKQAAALRVFRTFDNSAVTDGQYYNPVMYSCVLPTTQVPNAVAISNDKHCGSISRSKRTRKLLAVSYEKWSPMKEFGVCVHSPLFNMSDHEFVAAFVEMNQILGAEWFTFYIHSASRLVLKLLQTYQTDGLIEVARNWGKGMPNARYYGQDLSVQDCLYRNMYKVKYLVYTDLDEQILPIKHPNWHEMMGALDDGEISTFYFLHVALFTNTESRRYFKRVREIYGRCNDSVQLLKTPRLLSFTLRSKRMNKSKAKMILKPLTIRALRIHRVLEFVDKPHNRSTFVDSGIAFMLHYRLFGLDKFRKRTMYFDKLQRFVPQLFFNLKNRLCHVT